MTMLSSNGVFLDDDIYVQYNECQFSTNLYVYAN